MNSKWISNWKWSKIPFFYHYNKIYHKNLGKSQFSSSIIKRNFNIESKPMGFIWIFVVSFKTEMGKIRNMHGSYSKLAHLTRFLAWAKKQDFRVCLVIPHRYFILYHKVSIARLIIAGVSIITIVLKKITAWLL